MPVTGLTTASAAVEATPERVASAAFDTFVLQVCQQLWKSIEK